MGTLNMKVIDERGQFDARRARQILYEFSRDSAIVNQAYQLAVHLGLSSEETALLMAVSLLQSEIGLREMLFRDIETRIPTFRMQATKDGPFATQEKR